jgi:hypothetical protein
MIVASEDELVELAKVPAELWSEIERAGARMLMQRIHDGKAHRTYEINRAALAALPLAVKRLVLDDRPSFPVLEPSWAGVLRIQDIAVHDRRRRELGDSMVSRQS